MRHWFKVIEERYPRFSHLGRFVALVFGVVALLVLLGGLLIAVIGGYAFGWSWVGIGAAQNTSPSAVQTAKTLWDWLQLLIVPAVLALAALWFNARQNQTERTFTDEREKVALLESYLDHMSELLLDKGLRQSALGDEVRRVARTRTLTALRRLDKDRKVILLKFLYESALIDKENPIIDLIGADLSTADLGRTDLSGATLSRANLSQADLRRADLREADLYVADLRGAKLLESNLSEANLGRADLSGADLRGANLSGANLSSANLRGAKVTTEQLAKVQTLQGATLPNGSKYVQEHSVS